MRTSVYIPVAVLLIGGASPGAQAREVRDGGAGDGGITAQVSVLNFREAKVPWEPGPCAAAVGEYLDAQRIATRERPVSELARRICESGAQQVVLMSRAEPRTLEINVPAGDKDAPGVRNLETKQKISFNVTGNLAQGNQNNGDIGGNIEFTRQTSSHDVVMSLAGEYSLETTGTTYYNFAVRANVDHFLTSQWSLFAFANLGQDTKKQLVLQANEIAGFSYNLYEWGGPRELKAGAGIGHVYERLQDGSFPAGTNTHAFQNNNAILSYRVKYKESFWDDLFVVMTAVYFQHVLYSPADEINGAEFFNMANYRVMAELNFTLKLARFPNGSELKTDLNATYEYFVNAISASPYDLRIKSSLGVTF